MTILFDHLKWAKRRITQDLHEGFPKKVEDVLKTGDVIHVKKINKPNLWSLEQVPKVNGAVVVMNPWSGRVLALSGGFDFSINQFVVRNIFTCHVGKTPVKLFGSSP